MSILIDERIEAEILRNFENVKKCLNLMDRVIVILVFRCLNI